MAHVYTSELLAGRGTLLLYLILLLTAVLTAFYMFRWYYRVFAGEERMSAKARAHLHESPQVMTVPLLVLAFLSIFAGYIGLPEFAFPNAIAPWLETHTAATFSHPPLLIEWLLILLSVIAAAIGLFLGYLRYHVTGSFAARVQPLASLRQASASALGLDALYRALFVRPAEGLARGFGEVDTEVVGPGLQNSVSGIGTLGESLTQLQAGFVRLYALLMLLGLVALVVVVAFSLVGA